MEESVTCDPVSPKDEKSGICNQIIITDLTLSPNTLNENKLAISPQEKSLFAFPNALLNPENVEENDNTNQIVSGLLLFVGIELLLYIFHFYLCLYS